MSDRAMAGGHGEAHSTVGACDVTVCTHNRDHQCHAGEIHVAFVDGMAHCETYTPRDLEVGARGGTQAGAGQRS